MATTFRFRYFWPKFNQDDNFFISFFSRQIEDYRLRFGLPIEDLVIEFHSVFGRPRRLNRTRAYFRRYFIKLKRVFSKRIYLLVWYTGEDISPPRGYDLTLSYVSDSETNVYIPLWVIYLTEYHRNPSSTDREFTFRLDSFLQFRNKRSFEDCRPICTFVSNPTEERLRFILELERYGVLDVYGAISNRWVPNKAEIAKRYIFQLCLENSDSKDYVTEKPFEAWLSGNIPIYRDNNQGIYLNEESYVSIDISEPLNTIKQVKELLANPSTLEQLFIQPILKRGFDFHHLNTCLENMLKIAIAQNRTFYRLLGGRS